MEKSLNAREERLFELMELKSFSELSAEEREFVISQISEEEYENRRFVMEESMFIGGSVEAKPLVLKEQKRGVVIPLYQAVAGIAAAIIISFFVFKETTVVTKTIEKPVYAQTDTVFIDREIIDTVVEYRTEYIKVHQKENPVDNFSSASAEQFAFQDTNLEIPKISTLNLKEFGESAAEDETVALVQSINL